MKFSEKWLREWTNPELDTDQLVHQITMAGLEVDAVEKVADEFTGVVVGEVVSVNPHPDADKLRVCSVTDGEEHFQVVCGAPNVCPGMRVPFAKLGAVLPKGFKIKKAKLRGVESLGMLCAADELGLAETSDGLMPLSKEAPLGEDLRTYMQLDDAIIDVDLTPNRSDCLSVLGLAREVATLNNAILEEPEISTVSSEISDEFPVSLLAKDACPRYVGRIIKNVDLSNETPLWMVENLRRSGIRSIDPVVDVTNYVMLELGQPMHAFDLKELSEQIVVRYAKPEEKLTLLDGQEVEISPETLVIADNQKPLALAGIMGGEHSGVSASTKDIFLESAFFSPRVIAGKARSYGLHTDSSHRFERGVDWCHQQRAVERATELLLDIVGGQPGPVTEVSSKEDLPKVQIVPLRHIKVENTLGVKLNRTQVEELLARLGIVAEKVTKDGWEFKVPSHRFDISIEVDLIEEIARIYGYNNLPTTESMGQMKIPQLPENQVSLMGFKQLLVDMDFQEAVTYSFVDPAIQSLVAPDLEEIALANPIASDMSVMRTSLWPGLLTTAQYNQNRQQNRIRLFESGLRFVKANGEIEQESMLSGLIQGTVNREGWSNSKTNVDFYDIKGNVEKLLEKLDGEFVWEKAEHSALHPGQSAAIKRDGVVVGYAGGLHPKIAKTLNLNGSVYLFELFFNRIQEARVPRYESVSRFPEIRRDLAILIDDAISYSEVAQVIQEKAGEWRVRHQIFDVYHGESVGQGKKSLAMGIVWRHPDRTLRDEEVTEAFNNVINELGNRLGASLRS